MKKNLSLSLLILTAGLAAQDMSLLPDGVPWTLVFRHAREDSLITYKVFAGTNLVKELDTTDFFIVGTTNGVSTIRAAMPGLSKGTNLINVVAYHPVATTSEPSTNFTLYVLGKLAPPQGLERP